MGIQVVSFRCTLTNRLGRLISSTVSQNVLLHPGAEHVPLKALTEGMRDLKKGERRLIAVSAGEAYGFYDPDLVITRDVDDARASYKMHESVKLIRDGQTLMTRVIDVAPQTVTLDGNHPLAGQDLIFEILALDARDATPDEIEESVEPAAAGVH